MSSSKKYPDPLEIRITETAEVRMNDLLAFVEFRWGKKSKNKLLHLLIKGFHQVAHFPKSGTQSGKNKEILQLVITKQTSFYYQIAGKEIYILSVFDNRMDDKNRR